MTEFPADQPAEHPTGFPVETEPQGRPDPETEPGGGEPDFDSEPDRGTTDFLAPSNNPADAANEFAGTADADDLAGNEIADVASPADDADLAEDAGTSDGDDEVASDVPAPGETPWGSTPETPWEPDAETSWGVTASTDDASTDDEVNDDVDDLSHGDSAVGSDEVVVGATATSDVGDGVADGVADGALGSDDADEADEPASASAELADDGLDEERGHPVVGETVERLEELRDRPVSEHAEVYADLHERLQSALAEADRTDGEHASERV